MWKCPQIWCSYSYGFASAEVERLSATLGFQLLFSTSPSSSLASSGHPSYAALWWSQAGRLLSHPWPPRWRPKKINGKQSRTHAEGHPGNTWLCKHLENERVTRWPSAMTAFGKLWDMNGLKPNITRGQPDSSVTFTVEPRQSEHTEDSALNREKKNNLSGKQ